MSEMQHLNDENNTNDKDKANKNKNKVELYNMNDEGNFFNIKNSLIP